MTSSPQSFNKQKPFVLWELFGIPSKPRDIGGSLLRDQYIQNCVEISEGREHRLEKGILYYGGGWEGVSQISPQTSNELSIIRKQEFSAYVEPTAEILIIELGPGDTKKTKELLHQVCQIDTIKSIRYIAVDFNQAILNGVQRLENISQKIQLYCLWGSFDDALNFIEKWEYGAAKIYVWSLGSTMSNDLESVVSDRLRNWSAIGELLIGQDSKQSHEEMEAVYKSPAFTAMLDCGLQAANKLIGRELFCETNEKIYEFGESKVYISIIRSDGKRNGIFVAFKYNEGNMRDIAWQAGCNISAIWALESSRIYHMLVASPPETAE